MHQPAVVRTALAAHDSDMTTIALIPVRGGSKSIPGKNIKLLGGRPLLHWTLQAALDAKRIDAVYVSSDSESIRECARQLSHPKLHVIERAAELANDTASTEAVMLDFARRSTFSTMVLIQATSPLTTAADLDDALGHLAATGADSLLTVTHEHRFRWAVSADGFVTAQNYNPEKRPRRQDWSGEMVENGAFYVCSRQGLLDSGSRLHGKVAHYVMSGHTAVEIDNPADWEILEALVARRGTDERRLTTDPRLLITDVDGVLTDGGMYYGATGEQLKKFNTRDGMGARFWQETGREIAIVTGENSETVARRAEKLGIATVRLGVQDKLAVISALARERNLELSQLAYIGDDLNDLEAMQRVGFAGCPSDAHSKIQGVVHYRCRTRGGEGCLREFVEHMLGSLRER